MILQEISYKEMEVFIALILQMGLVKMTSVKIYCKSFFFNSLLQFDSFIYLYSIDHTDVKFVIK
jgi:hypothetical protein